ncbi:PAS domain S-box protein [Maribellus sp. CM-23]|uniref:PAS domain S-box protein n=1 Tax=Maribellus sp. CM-23 TaxID=2781026 RepID=UPI001F1DEAC4|nr:PAS domain S-box protein [Maribellus sp. CM-23]MCE4564963.1 PAS domain S-box protein [Maribellus sp. CM-23]
MFKILIQNAALLIALSFLNGTIKFYRPKKEIHFQLLSGTWFGLVAVAAMMMPYQYEAGTIYDGRSVVLTLAGLWGGGIPTLISIIIAGSYRAFLGGTGIYVGIATIVFCGLTGMIFRHYLRDKLYKVNFFVFLGIGFVTQLVMLASQLMLPGDPIQILKRIGGPILLIFPPVFAFIAQLFQVIDHYIFGEQRIRAAEELYRTTLLSIGDAVICTNSSGEITQMNPVAENLTGWKFSEARNKNLEEVFNIINELSREKAENPVKKVLEEGTIVGLANHTLLISKDGNEIPIADSGAPIKNKDNQIIGVVMVFRDQTAEREQQLVLEKSEAKYREREFWLRESQRVGKIGSYNMDIVNNQWKSSTVLDKIFGITQEDDHSLASWNKLVHPDQQEEMMDYFLQHVVGKKQAFEKEYKIIRANDGAERWVSGRGELRFNEAGEPIQMVGTIHDITDQKLFEQQLLESEERFRNSILMAPIPIMVHDDTGKILNLSEGWSHFSGYTIDEVPDLRTWTQKAFGPKAEEVEEYVNSLYDRNETIFSGEFEITAKNGTKRTWFFYHTPIGKSGGKNIMLNIAPDITQRIRTKKELEESELAYRMLFEDHIAVKLLIDPQNGTIITANHAAADFYGWSIEQLRNMKISDINCLPGQEVKEHMNTTLANKRLNIDFKHRLANGEIRDVEVFSSRVDYKGKQVLHSIIHDVTDKKQLLHELISAKEKAVESERLKSAFLANVSHEIRTPLNGIVGFSNILSQDENLSKAEKTEFSQIINKSSEGLLKIINDILDISRLETAKASFDEKPFDVGNMLENIHSIFRKRLASTNTNGFKLLLKKPEKTLIIDGDEDRITQIFSNLIDNAIRFTHSGNITFGVASVGEKGAEFFVSDTGIGIPKEKQKHIFERFTQADAGTSRSYGGTGLGLAIVKKLLEMMNSEIHLHSAPGKGTRFWFSLNYLSYDEQVHQQPVNNTSRESQNPVEKDRNTKILIVEDDMASIYFFRQVLGKSYSNLLFAETGAKALELYQSNAPDIILIDIGLPDMSGLEVIRKIRETDKQVKIIVQTAYAMAEDERTAREAGCNDFFTKPLKTQVLLEKLQMSEVE